MDIQVGEYIRTKNGYIRKIVEKREELDDYCYIVDVPYFNEIINEDTLGIYSKEDVSKHSFNIIDLIEEGDYVNGLEVVTIDGYDEDGNDKQELGILETYVDEVDGIYLTDVNIKSIATKEQFKAMEYEVK